MSLKELSVENKKQKRAFAAFIEKAQTEIERENFYLIDFQIY